MHKFERPNYASISREDAIERIVQLEDVMGLGLAAEFHPRYNLSNVEAAFLGVLASSRGVCTKEHAYTLLYGMHDDPPGPKILDVWLCKLRKKLAGLDISIQTIWGRGWYLEDEDRAKVDLMRFRPTAAPATAAPESEAA